MRRGGNAHVAHTSRWPNQFESKQEKFPASRHACLQEKKLLRRYKSGFLLCKVLNNKMEKDLFTLDL